MDKILGAWTYFMSRLSEPSTHASVAALLAMGGMNLDAGIVHDAMTATGIAFGMLGFFVRESKQL